jgi:hypothetical protein
MGRFPKRTQDDVAPFLRPAEFEELEALLDPAQEVNFKLHLSRREFRDWQRKRIHLMREYLLRMSHNALVLIEWGNMECARTEIAALPATTTGAASEALAGKTASDANQATLAFHLDQQRHAQARELVQAATEFRLYSLLALARLKLWILLPPSQWSPLSTPSLPGLRRVFGIDAVSSYYRLKEAAGTLSMAYGYDYHRELTQRL